MDHFGASLELKTVDVAQRLISGYAAVHSNIDRVRDIIDPQASVKAIGRLSAPSDVAVFIGHDSSALPIGIPQKIEATPKGLYTETYILQGHAGDNLLAVASDLHAHGHSLGMSIGYRTEQSKPERLGTKTLRRILDYSLKEFSYAASQVIANPAALTMSVKAGSDDAYHVAARSGRYHVLEADGTSLIDFATEVEATAAVAALRADGAEDADEPDDDDTPNKTDPPAGEVKAVWSTAMVDSLSDACFLMISPGGQKDAEGKTVPRSLRHFPYKDAEGKVDLPHLRDAIGRIPQASGLDAGEKARLQARARKLLEDAGSGKTILDADADQGAPLTIRALGYELLDLSDALSGEHKAMALLGEDIKGGERIRAETRAKLIDVSKRLASAVAHAAAVDSGEDALHKLALFRQQLALTEV